MMILGIIIALLAALFFAAVALLTVWGGLATLRSEIQREFVSVPPSPVEWLLTIGGVVVPLVGAALLALFAAWRIALVAFGLG